MRYLSVSNHNQTAVSYIITRSFDPFSFAVSLLCTANLHSHFFYCKSNLEQELCLKGGILYLCCPAANCFVLLHIATNLHWPLSWSRTAAHKLFHCYSLLNTSNDPTEPENCFIDILTTTPFKDYKCEIKLSISLNFFISFYTCTYKVMCFVSGCIRWHISKQIRLSSEWYKNYFNLMSLCPHKHAQLRVKTQLV